MDNTTNVVTWPGWETVRRIGSGSYGTVYEIQRDVYGDTEKAALKVISVPRNDSEIEYLRGSGLDDASITKTFEQQLGDIAKEYKLMARLSENPNIVRCDDFRDIQHEDGIGWDIYIKMELLTPLMKRLEAVSSEEQIIRLGKDICNALITCQELNIIHRDIKPQNVFISRSGRFKLGDFGIARTMERATQATAGIGTYSYMAPEVEKNESYGMTADIYSLGLMLYWCLNERRGAFMPLPPQIPKYGDEEQARARRFSGEAIPAPKNGSDALKRIVLKACAYDPADRYQTAREMYEELCALEETDAWETEGTVGMFPVREDRSVTVVPEPVQEDLDATVGPAWETKPVNVPPAPKKKNIWPIIGIAAAALVIAIVVVFLTVPLYVTEIAVSSFPDKTQYAYGEELDLEGLNLRLTYQNGKSEIISDGFEYSVDDMLQEGTHVVSIIYENHETSFPVSVGAPGLVYVEIGEFPLDMEYWVGDTLSTEGLQLWATYQDGRVETVTEGFECTGGALTEQGIHTIEVHYSGFTTTFDVVVDRPYLELSSYAFANFHKYHNGTGYVHVTPQTWDTARKQPFWKIALPEVTTYPAGCEFSWEVTGGDAVISPDGTQIWIYNIGTIRARAKCTYNAQVYYSDEYIVEFNLYKETANDNHMWKNPNDLTKGTKLCVLPGKNAEGVGTFMYFTEIRAFPEQYEDGVRRRCLWGKTTYTDENGNTYTGWVACSKDDIPSYP